LGEGMVKEPEGRLEMKKRREEEQKEKETR
jgi:hypothetical protein